MTPAKRFVSLKTLVLLAGATALVALFGSLGQWQLRRAEQHEELSRLFLDGGRVAPLAELPDTITPPQRYRRLELTGSYLPDTQILLDNMTHQGTAGYQVLTPFAPAGGRQAVVVNRGWVPASPDRSELPAVAVAAGQRTLRARIDTLPSPALRLGDDDSVQSGPLRVRSFPRHADLERDLGRSLYPYQLLLDDSEPDGYVRPWAPPGPGAARNLAYAGQWFLLAAATAVAAFGIAFRGRSRRLGRT